MKKTPTIFVRDMSKQPALVTTEWKPGCEWVRDGEGVPTLKIDGTCCMVRDGKYYKRREVKAGQPEPAGFERADYDEETGKTVGWVLVEPSDPDNKYHVKAWKQVPDGTYELVGPKIQGNKGGYEFEQLIPHGSQQLEENPRTFDEIRAFLDRNYIEGIVWHHPDGRMAKIKRRDFGFRW